MNAEQLWLSAAIVLFILEVFTPGFVLANFGVAAIASAVAAWMDFGIEVQLGVFAVTCLVSFITLRPVLRRTVLKDFQKTPTGTDALIERQATVTEEIPGGLQMGRVQIDGDSWRAIATNKQRVEKGSLVRIVSVDSTTLIVEQLEENTNG